MVKLILIVIITIILASIIIEEKKRYDEKNVNFFGRRDVLHGSGDRGTVSRYELRVYNNNNNNNNDNNNKIKIIM